MSLAIKYDDDETIEEENPCNHERESSNNDRAEKGSSSENAFHSLKIANK